MRFIRSLGLALVLVASASASHKDTRRETGNTGDNNQPAPTGDRQQVGTHPITSTGTGNNTDVYKGDTGGAGGQTGAAGTSGVMGPGMAGAAAQGSTGGTSGAGLPDTLNGNGNGSGGLGDRTATAGTAKR